MIHKSKLLFVNIALTLVALLIFTVVSLTAATPAVFAAGETITLTPFGPSYVRAGGNITYELTLKNFTAQPITAITVWNPLPANTTYVSGGTLFAGDNGVAFNVSSLAANATQKLILIVKVNNGVALGTVIENKDIVIENFTTSAGSFSRPAETAVGTTVEAPGTQVAIYKNASGTSFDVAVNGYSFDNYSNTAPRVFSDDLGTADMFALFGPAACQSGTTAATCVLSGPARKWMNSQIAGMDGGHCEGMAATSLRLFDELPFKGLSTPASFQPGATQTIDLSFPRQSVENYVSYYFITQSVEEYYNNEITKSPKELVNQLIADFNLPEPIPYTVGIYQIPGFKHGHAITAYGVETVNANESRILVYDNNFPKQRKYITVDMTANSWRYVTAATPGEASTIYTGTANSGNLSLHINNSRDLPAGQYFTCPFCNGEVTSATLHGSATGEITSTIRFEYAGEGAFLVANDADQSTGYAFDTETFINEIPGATVNYFKGGLGKDVPPAIEVPFVAAPNTIYSVYISGKTIDAESNGSLTMTGEGYAMGLDDIQLSPDEFLELAVSPNGDYIDFKATQTITAPTMYLAYDPVSPTDPSVIFEVSGIILDAGESVLLSMDRDLERVYFDDTGAQGQGFDVFMTLIWPDGDVEEYYQPVDVPAGSTSAFIDFGAWDGLLSPPLYIDDVLQNPSVNHRLKLTGLTETYDPVPQANAPQGVYHVNATFTNVTEITLEDLSFVVANVVGGNVVLNADGGPGGLAAKISVPAAALGSDGFLEPNESFTFSFDVGLAGTTIFDLTVNANGYPVDWMLTDPAPTGDANNASFAFEVGANIRRVYLPLIAK